MNIQNTSLKNLITVLVLAIVLVFSGSWLFHYLTVGKLIISTSDSASSITITAFDPNFNSATSTAKKGGYSKQVTGSFSSSIHSGSYTIQVSGSSLASSQTVIVHAHQTTRLVIKPSSTVGVEPVVTANTSSLIADASRLLYLDQDTNAITQINNQNTASILSPNVQLQSVAWADTSFGVGQDTAGTLYTVQNGQITALSTPVNSKSNVVIYAVAPNHEIYLNFGSVVYVGTANGGFHKIYSKASGTGYMVAADGKVAIITLSDAGDQEVIKPSIVVVSDSGQVTSTALNAPAAAWSQSGKYLAVASDTNGQILDSSLHKIAVIPQKNFTNLSWVNDTTMLYSLNDQLWSYSLTTQRASLLANMPLGDQIQKLTVSSDKSYAYVTTLGTDDDSAIRRVSLNGQKPNSSIYDLESALSVIASDTGYSLSLYNFSGAPTVEINVGDDTDQTSAILSVKQALLRDGVDPARLQFAVSQGE